MIPPHLPPILESEFLFCLFFFFLFWWVPVVTQIQLFILKLLGTVELRYAWGSGSHRINKNVLLVIAVISY